MRRLAQGVRGAIGSVYGKKGKAYLQRNIGGYNRAACFAPWVVIVDLNQSADCAPLLRDCWLPSPAPYMHFRVAVRAVEAWLLADRERLAKFLRVRTPQITRDPEAEDDPKRTMVELARKSRRRGIREDMVPRSGSGRKVGPAYTSRLIEFVGDQADGWRPDVAAGSSDSLNRCLQSLRSLKSYST